MHGNGYEAVAIFDRFCGELSNVKKWRKAMLFVRRRQSMESAKGTVMTRRRYDGYNGFIGSAFGEVAGRHARTTYDKPHDAENI